jgi:hypothetical protein
MTILLIEGPEKSGKTTLARQLLNNLPGSTYTHWGPIASPDEYIEPMLAHAASPHVHIWDRGWPSESIYSSLMPGRVNLLGTAWWGEWLFRRPALTGGMAIVLLGHSSNELASRRTPDDLPVDPAVERDAYNDYAQNFRYPAMTQPRVETIGYLWRKALERAAFEPRLIPPLYAGPRHAPVVFMGDALNESQGPGWSPFGSCYTSMYGRCIGRLAWHCGWTNSNIDPTLLKGRAVIACGAVAQQTCRAAHLDFEAVPHPSWLYRWGAAKAKIRVTEDQILRTVTQVLRDTKEVTAMTLGDALTPID